MQVIQDRQVGLQKAAESYISAMQIPWLYMTEPLGVTPSPCAMHAGMFMAAAQFPFGAHVTGATSAGFGAERALKEVCGITKDEQDKFDRAFRPIAEELERFDNIVLQKLQKHHPHINTLSQMREEMHRSMIAALQSFSEQKKIVSDGEKIEKFTDMFTLAKARNIPLNNYDFMSEFETFLFAASSVTKDITAIATAESRRTHDGKNHIQILSNTLTAHGARATIYDAVTIAAAEIIRENGELKHFFNSRAGGKSTIINISNASLERLNADRSDLYAAFVNGVRKKLTLDGTLLLQGEIAKHPSVGL